MFSTAIRTRLPQATGFSETSWGLITQAGRDGTAESRAAMEVLCRTYWYPVYAFTRRLGYGSHEAEDLTQELFVRILEKNSIAGADPRKGKFRSFLIGVLKNVMADRVAKDSAAKRGRNIVEVVDLQSLEGRYLQEPSADLTPEEWYDRRWAATVLETALFRLEAEYAENGESEAFQLLRPYLTDEVESGDYERLSGKLRIRRGAVAVMVHRLRKRFRDRVRSVVASTVLHVGEIEEEMQRLFRS
jgi:RNA polymerase sigma factor (sigma-70 family)